MDFMQNIKKVAKEMCDNAIFVFENLDKGKIEETLNTILNAQKIFVLGAGQSGLVGKILAMKLSHLGFSSFAVGEVITPPFGEKDILIAISRSGKTSSVVNLAQKAKSLGGKVVAITSSPSSTLAKLSDICVLLPAKSEKSKFKILALIGDEKYKNLSGALFGFNLFILSYGVVCELIKRTGQSSSQIDLRHANLE